MYFPDRTHLIKRYSFRCIRAVNFLHDGRVTTTANTTLLERTAFRHDKRPRMRAFPARGTSNVSVVVGVHHLIN